MQFRRFTSRQRRVYGLAIALATLTLAYGTVRAGLADRASTDLTAHAAIGLPDPPLDIPATAGEQTVVLAGGCFWGMEAVFEHLKGVSQVVSGFSGGSAATAHYEQVSTGATGHAESVQITYDPAQISYGQLLKVYFFVAHNPTELNRQGPDVGTQYRSAIFYTTDQQRQVAEAYIDQINRSQLFSQAIATQLVPLKGFYAAEAYHQQFIERNPANLYVMINDLPKLQQLQQQFPDLYQP